jgi:probable F420-dependent oxidoreductase
MKIGVQFPNESFISDPLAIRDFAQTAEGLNYSHLLIYEHVIGAVHAGRNPPLAVPYDEATLFHEPLVLLGYLSAFTSSIELATGVVVLPQRQTALVAKQTAEVAFLSNERLRLGIGVGWNYVEYAALNEDFSTRGARQAEQIEVLRKLWSEPVVDFKGRWHHLDRVGIAPRPERPIPIWIGGFSDAAYRRAARLADGFIYSLYGPTGPDPDPKKSIQRLLEMVEDAGRDPSEFGIEVLVPLSPPPGEFAQLAAGWEDTGVTHVTLHLLDGQRTPAQLIAALGEYQSALS